MGHLTYAIETLNRAESDLRELVAKAAASGDYAAVVRIASWAQAVNDLAGKKPSSRDSGIDFAFSNGAVGMVGQVKPRSTSKKHVNDYPRFFRHGNELVRVAWSRRAKSEYQHKTSEAVLKTVADTLTKVGSDGRIFSTDEFLPIRDPEGVEVPAYQIYVCIALLKLTGLIEQHGRQGYSISTPDEFTDSVDAIWRKLPSSK